VIEALVMVVFLVPAAFIAWSAVRVLRAPDKGWAAGRARWMALGSRGAGARRPDPIELRFWAAVWLSIAAAIVALAIAIALVQ
jgi:hypothetical protein